MKEGGERGGGGGSKEVGIGNALSKTDKQQRKIRWCGGRMGMEGGGRLPAETVRVSELARFGREGGRGSTFRTAGSK
jgi:hypothetical protein